MIDMLITVHAGGLLVVIAAVLVIDCWVLIGANLRKAK